LAWTAGAEIGGTPIIDYQLSYDQGNSDYVIYKSGILETQYIVEGLLRGTVYKFKV
jgi:hypothetical protein